MWNLITGLYKEVRITEADHKAVFPSSSFSITGIKTAAWCDQEILISLKRLKNEFVVELNSYRGS